MVHKVRGNHLRTTVICIDSYQDKLLTGRFFNAFQAEGEQFTGLMQLLLKMERLLDTMDFPQSFASPRTFAPLEPPSPANVPHPKTGCGKLATFEVRLLFRQNSSWQGCVTWLEGGQEESFRSVLELSILIDSALSVKSQEKTPA